MKHLIQTNSIQLNQCACASIFLSNQSDITSLHDDCSSSFHVFHPHIRRPYVIRLVGGSQFSPRGHGWPGCPPERLLATCVLVKPIYTATSLTDYVNKCINLCSIRYRKVVQNIPTNNIFKKNLEKLLKKCFNQQKVDSI